MVDYLSLKEAQNTSKTLKVLAIGNSFSEDATSYIKQMSLADNIDLRVANAFIGGCSLEHHYNNITNGAKDYLFTYYTPKETFVFRSVSLEQCL